MNEIITTNWIICQFFAFIALIICVISFQQKTTIKLILLRNFATLSCFIGLCFLGNISAIIMCFAEVIRNLVTLYFAYRPNTKKIYKIVSSILIVLLLIILNIIYWTNYYNILSIIVGSFAVITFMQEKPATIRKFSVIAELFYIIYYGLLLSPINVVIEVLGLISAIIGIIRLDKNVK